jgi:CRISPR-associated protein Cas1
MPRIVSDVQALLTPRSASGSEHDDPDERSERHDIEMVHPWDPKAGILPAGVNYAAEGDH